MLYVVHGKTAAMRTFKLWSSTLSWMEAMPIASCHLELMEQFEIEVKSSRLKVFV